MKKINKRDLERLLRGIESGKVSWPELPIGQHWSKGNPPKECDGEFVNGVCEKCGQDENWAGIV